MFLGLSELSALHYLAPAEFIQEGVTRSVRKR
jgi:hypothetical protein